MTVGINVPTGVAWLDHLNTTWLSNFLYDGHGIFSPTTAPYDQWVAGNSGTAQSSVILDGDDFTYVQPGGFSGDIESLSFGSNLTGSAGTGFSQSTFLTLDLSNATLTTAFTLAIYHLSNNQNLSYLYAYLGQQGTEQQGAGGSDDYFYSFSGNDTFTGSGASDEDTFFFDATYHSTSTGWGHDVINDFVDGYDTIELAGYWANYSAFISDPNVSLANNGSGDAVISYTDANSVTSTITVVGVGIADLTGVDFYVHL